MGVSLLALHTSDLLHGSQMREVNMNDQTKDCAEEVLRPSAGLTKFVKTTGRPQLTIYDSAEGKTTVE